MAIKHAHTATTADDPGADIQPSHWNADHEGTNAHTHQSASEGGDLRASAAEVLAGTSEAKFATPKAIADAGITPNISNTGWIAVADTWVYASATTITVPSGAATYYQRGDRIKLTANGVVLQAVIVKVADTLLTVRGDTLTNHSFSAIYYSHMDNPLGWKDYFAYTPSGPTNSTLTGQFKIFGHSCFFKIKIAITGTPSFANMPTLPVTASGSAISKNYLYASYARAAGIGRYGKLVGRIDPSATRIVLMDGEKSNLTDNMYTDISASAPVTWVNGDTIELEGIYEWGETS